MDAWTIAGVGFGSALLGALVGGLTTLMLEVWRRVLDGVSAARLIRMELLRIRTTIEAFLDGRGAALTLADSSWQSSAVAVAPLLNEVELSDLYRGFAFLPEIDRFAKLLREDASDIREKVTGELVLWRDELGQISKILYQVESRAKMSHMWRILVGGHLANLEELEARASTATTQSTER